MATTRQRKAIAKLVENGGSVSAVMREVGYSDKTAKTPQKLTESKAWIDLVHTFLSDEELAEKHKQLLNSTRIDHMVFPLGPRNEDDPNYSGGKVRLNDEDVEDDLQERTSLTDGEIIEMLADVNCKVRRIVHGETARHVYFWSADNKARKDGLDMAYKLKGHYAAEKHLNVNLELEASDEIRRLTKELNELHRGTSK